jgi:hypothetical protein
MVYLKALSHYSPRQTEKTMKSLNYDKRYPSEISNRQRLEYKCKAVRYTPQ